MALDFTVIFSVRQRFGDNESDDEGEWPQVNVGLEMDAPFVGREKSYNFNCPDVDSSQYAVLLYQSQGVNSRQLMFVNNIQVYGGIPSSIDIAPGPAEFIVAQWNGNVMLISPGVLQTNNVLKIQSDGDNFIIDNVVVLFKTGRYSIPTDSVITNPEIYE